MRQNSGIITSRFCITSFTKAVQAPSPNVILVVNSKSVILSACDELGIIATDTNQLWFQVFLVASEKATAELVMFARAPGPDVTFAIEG